MYETFINTIFKLKLLLYYNFYGYLLEQTDWLWTGKQLYADDINIMVVITSDNLTIH